MKRERAIEKPGYTDCRCPTCFDATVSSDVAKPELCSLCEEAGCDGEGECRRTDDVEEATPANPYDWHLAPAGETGPCSVCGSAVAGRRQHRRAHSDRMWICRGAQPAVAATSPDPKG